MNGIKNYMKLNYPVEIKVMPDGVFRAEIKEVSGLCAYGNTMSEALNELENVKSAAFELMLKQKKTIPLPKIKIEIPVLDFEKLKYKDKLREWIVV